MPNNYTNIAICSPGYDFDVKAFNEKHKDTCFCSIVRPMPDDIREIPSISYPDGTTEKQRRGASQDWCDWAKEHWGTKWGTYDNEAFDLGGDSSPVLIKFQSAWFAPSVLNLIAAWLKQEYGFNQVSFIGFDPYDDSLSFLFSEHKVKEAAQ